MTKFDTLFEQKLKIYEATSPTTDPADTFEKNKAKQTAQAMAQPANPMAAKAPQASAVNPATGQPPVPPATAAGQGTTPATPVSGRTNNQAQAAQSPQAPVNPSVPVSTIIANIKAAGSDPAKLTQALTAAASHPEYQKLISQAATQQGQK